MLNCNTVFIFLVTFLTATIAYQLAPKPKNIKLNPNNNYRRNLSNINNQSKVIIRKKTFKKPPTEELLKKDGNDRNIVRINKELTERSKKYVKAKTEANTGKSRIKNDTNEYFYDSRSLDDVWDQINVSKIFSRPTYPPIPRNTAKLPNRRFNYRRMLRIVPTASKTFESKSILRTKMIKPQRTLFPVTLPTFSEFKYEPDDPVYFIDLNPYKSKKLIKYENGPQYEDIIKKHGHRPLAPLVGEKVVVLGSREIFEKEVRREIPVKSAEDDLNAHLREWSRKFVNLRPTAPRFRQNLRFAVKSPVPNADADDNIMDELINEEMNKAMEF